MSAPWYDVAKSRPEAAFELYHENSKRSRSDGITVHRRARLSRCLARDRRHLAAMETAAATAGLRLDDTVAFYDREVDALLVLDGLTRSVLAVVAVGSARG